MMDVKYFSLKVYCRRYLTQPSDKVLLYHTHARMHANTHTQTVSVCVLHAFGYNHLPDQ